eukprot:215868_1
MQKSNFVNSTDALNNVNVFNIHRYEAVYGKEYIFTNNKSLDEHLTAYCRHFCPFAMIGCGLSHYSLLKHIYNNDVNEFALILEDDATPNNVTNNNLTHQIINDIIKNAPIDWDVILLHCRGMCQYDENTYNVGDILGSAAAYLVKKQSIQKMIFDKLWYHIDCQQWFKQYRRINLYKSPNPLFITNDTDSWTTPNVNSLTSIMDRITMLTAYITVYYNGDEIYNRQQELRKHGQNKVFRLYTFEFTNNDILSFLMVFYALLLIFIFYWYGYSSSKMFILVPVLFGLGVIVCSCYTNYHKWVLISSTIIVITWACLAVDTK